MEKLFVPYEIALELMNLGFNEKCIRYYHNDNLFDANFYLCSYNLSLGIKNNELIKNSGMERYVVAPMYQQVLDWLREKHNIHIEISSGGLPSKYHVFVHGSKYGYIYSEPDEICQFEYYEGLNRGIEEAIKLI